MELFYQQSIPPKMLPYTTESSIMFQSKLLSKAKIYSRAAADF